MGRGFTTNRACATLGCASFFLLTRFSPLPASVLLLHCPHLVHIFCRSLPLRLLPLPLQHLPLRLCSIAQTVQESIRYTILSVSSPSAASVALYWRPGLERNIPHDRTCLASVLPAQSVTLLELEHFVTHSTRYISTIECIANESLALQFPFGRHFICSSVLVFCPVLRSEPVNNTDQHPDVFLL